MSARHCMYVALACASLTGCPVGTPNDHYRPHGHQDITIDISPDDEYIVFNGKGSGGRDLYLLRLSNMAVTSISATDDYETTPSFSPDGKSIVYAAGTPGDKADHIFTIHRDGTAKTQLTTANANDTQPCYSPDGQMIAFARDKTYVWGGLAANWENGGVICVVNADGTNERQLTSDDEFAWLPCFSTDGKSVIYSTQSGLYAVSVTGDSAPRRIGATGFHLAIAFTGEDVVFAEGKYSPDHELIISKIDGAERRQITSSDDGCFHPIFNSGGDRVFFLMEGWPDGPSGYPKASIWSVSTEGDEQKQVTDIGLFDDPMTWQPNRSQ